ncbi:hypothetical protein PLEOSDRAFT_161848 [Pleurotus ostreatus PC15]|uniref:Uncharacterized protein n=1 Tax=Pleurotus ostreatus (strain PC15) TaxID=1137138 RepID=A0A067NJ76_PLEO1|nr:hypothetical protein PLEOSDRAFT_161848 [Pleurotus ostreatus PC15]
MFDRSSTNFLMKIATDGVDHNYAANFDASSDYIAASDIINTFYVFPLYETKSTSGDDKHVELVIFVINSFEAPTSTPTSTPPPSTTLVVTSTSGTQIDAVIQTTLAPTISRNVALTTAANDQSNSNGFFSNTGAVAGGRVFTVVGVAILAVVFALITNAVRKHRACKFDREIADAAAEAAAQAPALLDDNNDDNNDVSSVGQLDTEEAVPAADMAQAEARSRTLATTRPMVGVRGLRDERDTIECVGHGARCRSRSCWNWGECPGTERACSRSTRTSTWCRRGSDAVSCICSSWSHVGARVMIMCLDAARFGAGATGGATVTRGPSQYANARLGERRRLILFWEWVSTAANAIAGLYANDCFNRIGQRRGIASGVIRGALPDVRRAGTSGSRTSLSSGSSEDNGYGGMAESEDEDDQDDGGRRVLKVQNEEEFCPPATIGFVCSPIVMSPNLVSFDGLIH